MAHSELCATKKSEDLERKSLQSTHIKKRQVYKSGHPTVRRAFFSIKILEYKK